MSAIKDGGPAFPVHPTAHERGDAEYAALSGMTLRDYFAAKALSGVVGMDMLELCMDGEQIQCEITNAAALAYRLADAMLRARKVQS